jgi:hypothetical protein
VAENSFEMSTAEKTFVVVAIVFAAVNITDFLFYGQQIRNLAGFAGFALMAFGTYKEQNWASISGAVLALVAIVVKYAT